MTDEQLSAAREEIQNLREEVREALAEDIGGDPEGYRSDRAVTGDGDE